MRTFSVRKTKEQFIAEAKAIHGDKYDYSQVDYVENKVKVCIICPIHGEFWQTPNSHLMGHGCKRCYFSSKAKFGVGIFDIPCACKKNEHFYKTWCSIMLRATNDKFKKTHNAYKDCSICSDWLTLSNFKKWFENPSNGYQDGFQIDKDILVKGNKEYAPDKCCFVPREINNAVSMRPKGKSNFIGAKQNGNKFEATISRLGKREYLGIFNTPLEAFNAYKIAKEQYIKELAEKYFQEGKITERVYNALMSYEVEMTD